MLHGKPMIAYTIEAALQSGVFEKVIVSTDDAEIADISRVFGAEVPFVREASLADDHTPASLVTLNALEKLDSGCHQNINIFLNSCLIALYVTQ